jgi:hypothetical protein
MPVYGHYFDTLAQRYYDTPGYGRIKGWFDSFMMHEHPRLKGTSTGEILKRAYDDIPSLGSSLASIAKREHEENIEEDRQGVIEDIEKNKEYEESQGGNENDEGDPQSIVRSKIKNEAQAKTLTERVIEYMGEIAQGVSDFSERFGNSERVLALQQQKKQISGLMMPRTARSKILASRLMY